VDQEGGRVRRLREPFTVFPCMMDLAKSDRPDESIREFARVTAREIRLAGFTLDFVPVLDVVTDRDELDESVIGDRGLGFDPQDVARLGRIIIETMRSEGVIPCCKHFPGHGGTRVDSHIDLPVDDREPGAFQACDLVPFYEAFKAKVEMTMTAHVLYPGLDPDLPATLSPAIVGDMLRRRMGFEGVVITDDLDMGAIAERRSPEESCLLAFSAGVDLLMFCNHPEKALTAKSRLCQAVTAGELEPARIRQALTRIRRLKADYAMALEPCNPTRIQQFVASRKRQSVS
jgi:beta-N-acetylhexosaminidase